MIPLQGCGHVGNEANKAFTEWEKDANSSPEVLSSRNMFCRAKDDVTGASHPSSSSNALPFSQPNLNGEPTRSSLLPDTLQHDPRLLRHHVPELSFCWIPFFIC